MNIGKGITIFVVRGESILRKLVLDYNIYKFYIVLGFIMEY
jgi:hypothetical protein